MDVPSYINGKEQARYHVNIDVKYFVIGGASEKLDEGDCIPVHGTGYSAERFYKMMGGKRESSSAHVYSFN